MCGRSVGVYVWEEVWVNINYATHYIASRLYIVLHIVGVYRLYIVLHIVGVYRIYIVLHIVGVYRL